MKILNLYAGVGGNRKLWDSHDVTAVEYNEQIAAIYQKRFPKDHMFIEDVLEFIRRIDLEQFDFIWASPPCKTHSCATSSHARYVPDLTQLYGLRLYLEYSIGTAAYKNDVPKTLYCIENVQPFYKIPKEWRASTKIDRHYFWANFPILDPKYAGFEETPSSRLSDDMINTNKHQRSLLMRGTIQDIADYHDFNLTLLDGYKGRKDTVVRNMTHYNIGDFILFNVRRFLRHKEQGLLRYLGVNTK